MRVWRPSRKSGRDVQVWGVMGFCGIEIPRSSGHLGLGTVVRRLHLIEGCKDWPKANDIAIVALEFVAELTGTRSIRGD